MSNAVSVSGWKKIRDHSVMCPSGARIVIRIPDLPKMIEVGQVPQHLLDAAIGAAATESRKPSIELIKQEREFTDLMVAATVIEPKLSDADIADIPYEDKEFIVSIAMRQRDLDAVGDHIAGLTDIAKFRRFRNLDDLDTPLEDA